MYRIDEIRNKIICGDCIEEMKKFPDDCIDTIITDPPYGLSNHSEKIIRKTMSEWLNGNEEFIPDGKGFMSKDWDAFVPPPALWKEVFRVMKPGATALVFAGSRTQDLMAMSLRLAGFEIKDTLMWLYGCVSEDTEILTINGWKKWNELREGEELYSFNILNGKIEVDMVLEKFVYVVDDELIHLKNDNTDQLITKNHKVVLKKYFRKQKNYIRRWEEPEDWAWDYAINLDNYTPIKLPLGAIYDGSVSIGVDFASLIGWILSEGHFYKEKNKPNTNDIKIYQSL
jgi:DNA modification methylase